MELQPLAGIYGADGKLQRTVPLEPDPDQPGQWRLAEPVRVDAGQVVMAAVPGAPTLTDITSICR